MNQKVILAGAAGVVLVMAFLFMKDDTNEIQPIETKIESQKEKSSSSSSDIKIDYEQTSKKSKTQEESKAQSSLVVEQNVFELDSSTVYTSNFAIKLVSKKPIDRDLDAFPRIPATIEGDIEGEKFVMLVPMNVKNSDLKLRIEDKRVGVVKELPFNIKELKSGSSNKLSGTFADIENAKLETSQILQDSDLPPAPPAF